MNLQEMPNPKVLRLLVIEGDPRADHLFMIGALRKDSTVAFHSYMASADEGWSQQHSPGLNPIADLHSLLLNPTALCAYDAIVWGNFNPFVSAAHHTKTILANLEAYIVAGGGVLFVAGAEYTRLLGPDRPFERICPVSLKPFDPQGTDPTVVGWIEQLGSANPLCVEQAVAELQKHGSKAWPDLVRFSKSAPDEKVRHLAHQLTAQVPSETVSVEPSRIRRTPLGEIHPALPTGRERWVNAPILRWWIAPLIPKSRAQILIETDGRSPILIARNVGKGRTAFMATDEWYNWRAKKGDVDYYALYEKILRWLARP